MWQSSTVRLTLRMNLCRILISSQSPDVVKPSTSPADNISGTLCELQQPAEAITQLGVPPATQAEPHGACLSH